MKHIGFRGVMAVCTAIMFMFAFGLMSSLATAADITVTKKLTINDIVDGPVEKFVQGGKFLEGPIMDKQGNLWVVSIASGWISKITPDGKFSFELTNCIGGCDNAPTMLINNDLHGNLTPRKVSQILKSYK